jgi:tRNA dimethylallyltransferase
VALLILTGPTGTGKTQWAVRLAERLPVEIVSVDSALVYRGLEIGAAKPGPELRARVPHHLIDVRDPAQSYSAGEFVSDALACIRQIRARGRIPLLVGGTMLYLRALMRGMAELPQASPELRRELDVRAIREGWPALHAELAHLDPKAAARIHPNDPQRIQRALEVCYATGEPISKLQDETRSPLEGERVSVWALVPGDRAAHRAALAERFGRMMAEGFLDEVRALRARGDLTLRHPSIRAVGYRQLWAHLEGACNLEEAVAQGVAATRQLAKRQLTWLRAEPSFRLVDPQQSGSMEAFRREAQTALRELGR